MSDSTEARSYFAELDGFMQEHGAGSPVELQKRVHHLQTTGELSIPAIGLFEVFVVCMVTLVFTLPALAVWMVLVITGGALVVLRVGYSQIMRRRWARLLAEWEQSHPLSPLAEEALARVADAGRPLHWMATHSPRTRLDWCLNYLAALNETRSVLAPAEASDPARGG